MQSDVHCCKTMMVKHTFELGKSNIWWNVKISKNDPWKVKISQKRSIKGEHRYKTGMKCEDQINENKVGGRRSRDNHVTKTESSDLRWVGPKRRGFGHVTKWSPLIGLVIKYRRLYLPKVVSVVRTKLKLKFYQNYHFGCKEKMNYRHYLGR